MQPVEGWRMTCGTLLLRPQSGVVTEAGWKKKELKVEPMSGRYLLAIQVVGRSRLFDTEPGRM